MREFGSTGRKISAVGLGCWAIGGHFTLDGRSDGWGNVDDRESERAIRLALDLGANLFDTADAYGTGHSELVLGAALKDRRKEAFIATKFGFTYDETRRALLSTDLSPEYIDWANAQSLRRLNSDYLDLYQVHPGAMSDAQLETVGEELERLVEKGRILAWGWSTDEPDAARRAVHFPHFVAVQQELNVLHDGPEMLAFTAENGLASINRSPLAMGLLSGKFGSDTVFGTDDVRGAGHNWVRHFNDGRPSSEALDKLQALRDLLQTDGRSLAQGALGWILARSPNTFPVPGFKTEAQVRDNLGALRKGPLPNNVMVEIDAILAGSPGDT